MKCEDRRKWRYRSVKLPSVWIRRGAAFTSSCTWLISKGTIDATTATDTTVSTARTSRVARERFQPRLATIQLTAGSSARASRSEVRKAAMTSVNRRVVHMTAHSASTVKPAPTSSRVIHLGTSSASGNAPPGVMVTSDSTASCCMDTASARASDWHPWEPVASVWLSPWEPAAFPGGPVSSLGRPASSGRFRVFAHKVARSSHQP